MISENMRICQDLRGYNCCKIFLCLLFAESCFNLTGDSKSPYSNMYNFCRSSPGMKARTTISSSVGETTDSTMVRTGAAGSVNDYAEHQPDRQEPPQIQSRMKTYLSLGISQRGSCGSSYSDTPVSIGVPLEERREGRTNITPEWIEELESTDT